MPLGMTRQQTSMVATLLCGALLVVLNQTLLSPALPMIMVHLNVDAMTVQWLTSAYALAEAVVIPLAAWFMGRFRTRPLFVGCMALFACGSLVCGTAASFSILLIGRILQACATGVMMVMAMSLILLSFPREMRGQAMGLVGLIIGFAPAVGPSIGGILDDAIGWRASFLVVSILAVCVIIVAARLLQNQDLFPRTHFDPLSVVFSSIGLASLLYGLGTLTSADNPLFCVGLMVFGIILVGLFAWRQTRLDEPMLQIRVFQSRRYRTACITVMLLQASLIGLSTLMPLYIQNTLGYSATASGLIMLPGALLGAFMGLIAGKVFDRSGVRAIALAGACAMVIGGAGMACYGIDSGLVLVIGVNVIFSLAIQAMVTPLNTWGVNSLSNDLVQHATSVTNTMNQVGASLGTALIMSFTAVGSANATGSQAAVTFAGYHCSFLCILVLSCIALCVVAIFARNRAGEPAVAAAAGTTEVPGAEHPHTIREAMDGDPLSIPADATLAQAARILAQNDASGATLTEEDSTVVGFLSNSDILRFFGDEEGLVVGGGSGFVALRQLDNEDVRHRVARLGHIKAIEVATKRVESVSPDASFEKTCSTLAEKRLKQIPVVENGKLVGVIHRHDLMTLISELLEEDAAE